MKKSKPAPTDIFALENLFKLIEDSLKFAHANRVEDIPADLIKLLDRLTEFSTLLNYPRYNGHAPRLQAVLNSIAKSNFNKALTHMGRLRKIVHRVANDKPYKLGAKVWVKRSEHGWEVGAGVVSKVYGFPPGNVSYDVLLDDGYVVYVETTRDLSLC